MKVRQPVEPQLSVIIPAHNEASVIGDCLDALLAEEGADQWEVIVVPNGCSDETAQIAATRPGVRVVELAESGKARALNAGDAVAHSFPRFYLDADIRLSRGAIRDLATALTAEAPPLCAVVPERRMVTANRPATVRAYYAVNTRLPIFSESLFGRGVIGVSAAGRRRFDRFPEQVADDLFLDSLFAADERAEVTTAKSFVQAPRRLQDLVRTLVRVRAGNVALRTAHAGIRASRPSSWLRDVVLPRPWLLPAGAVYVAITVLAALGARRRPGTAWGRDESTR